MRLFGHPVHLMLVHFPVALWPAHALLHAFRSELPTGAAPVVGFWLLATACGAGWLAALAGAMDLLAVARADERQPVDDDRTGVAPLGVHSAKSRPRFIHGIVHASVNSGCLFVFTVILALEWTRYPDIVHDGIFLVGEGILLGAMVVGNYFGAAITWSEQGSRG